jgi:hypothetical protein
VFVDVEAELRRSHDAMRRRRCLWALGCSPDPAATALLVQWTQGPHHDEAVLAAFVLAQRPRRELAEFVALAGQRAADLLRAALARAAVPDLETWIDLPTWTPSDRAGFVDGALPSFRRCLHRFRDRPASAGG